MKSKMYVCTAEFELQMQHLSLSFFPIYTGLGIIIDLSRYLLRLNESALIRGAAWRATSWCLRSPPQPLYSFPTAFLERISSNSTLFY